MCKWASLLSLACALLAAPRGGAQEIYKNVSKEKLEALLREMKIDYRKADTKNDGTYYYYFKHDNFDIRLHNYSGKDLWIDCVFTDKLAPELINRWNLRTKLSRAVLIRDGAQETVSFESQLDCLGGVTDAIIKRYVERFYNELDAFSKFIVTK